MNGELSLLDATAQAELVRTGQVTAAELVTAAIERIEALNPVLNAVVTPLFDQAADVVRTGQAGPFAGVCRRGCLVEDRRDDGVQRRVQRLDALDGRRHELGRGDLAGADQLGLRGGVEQ